VSKADICLAALLAFGRFLGARFFRRWLGGRKFDDYLAGYRVGEPELLALVFEMLAERVENVDHEGPRVDDLLEVRPFADEAESAAEALEAGIFHPAVLRNELLLMTRLDAEPHDIECRHVILPTVGIKIALNFCHAQASKDRQAPMPKRPDAREGKAGANSAAHDASF